MKANQRLGLSGYQIFYLISVFKIIHSTSLLGNSCELMMVTKK